MVKILLVEDDQFLSSILANHFRNAGYEVFCAYDGDAAVSRAIEVHIDVMVLDILLPNKDGFEVLSALRAMDATKDIPVIVVSNLSDEKTIENMKGLDVAQYLIKAHVTPQSVLEEIEKVLKARHVK